MDYFKDISMENKQEYLKEMKKYEKILNSLGYVMALTGGTMLGAIRDGKFIDYDNDIDLAVIMKGEDIEQIRLEKDYIVNYLIKLKYTLGKNNGSQFKTMPPNIDNFCLDTFTYYFNRHNKAYFYPYNGCFNKSDILPLITVKLYDVEFFALKDYNKIFTVLYDNWKIPQTKQEMLKRKLHSGSITNLKQISWDKYND